MYHWLPHSQAIRSSRVRTLIDHHFNLNLQGKGQDSTGSESHDTRGTVQRSGASFGGGRRRAGASGSVGGVGAGGSGQDSVVHTRDPSGTVTGERNVDVLASFGVEGEGAGVVVGRSKLAPGGLDSVKDTVSSRASLVASGRGSPHRAVVRVLIDGKRSNEGRVHVQVGGVDLVVGVSSLVGDNLEDVGTAIPATQGRKTPVGLNSGQGGVVGVESVISGSNEVIGNSTTEKDGENLVVNGVVTSLIKSEQNEGLIPEISVVLDLLNETTLPDRGESDVGVMSVIGHVGGDESPLGKSVVVNVAVQAGEVLDLSSTRSILCNRVKENERVVLANVVVGIGLLVGVVETLETSVGQTFLVFTPGDSLGVQQVNDSGDVGRDLPEVVVVHSKLVTSSSGGIVGLGRVSDGPEVGQRNSLGSQVLLVGVVGGIAVVLKPQSVLCLEFFLFCFTRSDVAIMDRQIVLTMFSSQTW